MLLALGLLLGLLLLGGCVTPPPAQPDLLKFLSPGHTTREEVILTLGQPSATFEQDRILTYRIGEIAEKGQFVISPRLLLPAQAATWQNVTYSLVLVFTDRGTLREHRLVKVQ